MSPARLARLHLEALFFSQKITNATFLEALRLFPIVPTIPKVTTSDTTITLHRLDSSNNPVPTQVFVPAGTWIVFDVTGAQYSSLYWEDPTKFNPSRFIDTEDYTWPRHGLVAFSSGRRACLGKAFASVESTLMLAMIVQRYHVAPPPDRVEEFKLRKGESEIERRQRLYQVSNFFLGLH